MLDPATLLQNEFPTTDCGIIVGEGGSVGFKDKVELEKTLSCLYPAKQKVSYKKINFPRFGKKVLFGFIEGQEKELEFIEEEPEPEDESNNEIDWESIRQQARNQMTGDTNIPPVDEIRNDAFGGILGTLEEAVGAERGTLFRREPPVQEQPPQEQQRTERRTRNFTPSIDGGNWVWNVFSGTSNSNYTVNVNT